MSFFKCPPDSADNCSMSENVAEFKKRLKKARTNAGLSQAQLAAACDASRQSGYDWENPDKKNIPTGPNLVRIALATNVRPEWLALGQGPIKDTGTTALTSNTSQIDEMAELVRLSFLDVQHVLDENNAALTPNDWADAAADQFRILYDLHFRDGLNGESLESAGKVMAVRGNVILAKFR